MSTEKNDNADWGLTAETTACDRWGFDHVANEDAAPDWFDAVATEPVTTPLVGTIVDEGTKVDAKAARVEVSDGTTGTRTGRWWFRESSHRLLLEDGGEYALAVYDTDNGILRISLASAETVDGHLEGRWTTAGAGHRADQCAQLPWTSIFDSLEQPDRGEQQ